MENRNELKQQNYQLIATKIDIEAYNRWSQVRKDGAFKSDYEMLQYLVSAFLRHADPAGDVEAESPMDLRLAEIFTDWQNEAARIIAVNPKSATRLKLVESINIYTIMKKRGYVVRKVVLKADGGAKVNNNIDAAINDVIRKLRPDMAEELSQIARGCGTENMVEAIRALLQDSRLPRLQADEDEAVKIEQNEYGNVPISHFSRRPKE